MPELPEVETVKNTLKEFLLNEKITNIDVFYDRIIDNVSISEFRESLIGEKFIDIKRKGKYLIFVLENFYLISHLRMEGKFFKYSDFEFSKHDHVIFYFKDFNLRYNDTRKFGRMYLFPKSVDIYKEYPLNVVGNDIFEGIDKDLFYKEISSKKIPIKTLLLDQSIMSGLGNIYVDEVCFMVGLHPETLGVNILRFETDKILDASRIVLTKAISLGGTTIKSFQSSHNITGRFQNELLVHTKSVCPNCGSNIEKIRVGGRGTYFCPTCQKKK